MYGPVPQADPPVGPAAHNRLFLNQQGNQQWLGPTLPKFGEDAHGPNFEISTFGQPHGFVEGTLLRLVVRDEDRLAHVVISLQHPFEEGPAYAPSVKIRMNQDVLEIADCRIVGNRPSETNQLAALAPGRYDK